LDLGDDPAEYAAVVLHAFANALGQISSAYGGPALSIFSEAVVDTLLALLEGKQDSYDAIRAMVLMDIRDELNEHDVNAMYEKMESISRSVENMVRKLGPRHINLIEFVDSLLNDTPFSELEVTESQREAFQSEVHALKIILDISRGDFMLYRDHYLSLQYYNVYATTHLLVLGLLQAIYSQDEVLTDAYGRELRQAAMAHYLYLSLAISEVVLMSERPREEAFNHEMCARFTTNAMDVINNGVSRSTRMECQERKLFETYGMANLLTIANMTLAEDTVLRSGDQVAFRYATLEMDGWLSCTPAGTRCALVSLVTSNNPFQFNCEDVFFENRGVIFKLYALERGLGDVIRSCDVVALLYESVHYNYLATSYEGSCPMGTSCYPTTSTCPGRTFLDGNQTTNTAHCTPQVFKIMVPGKKCGESPVLDHDPVAIISSDGRLISDRTFLEVCASV
jgi:hypothetical protein